MKASNAASASAFVSAIQISCRTRLSFRCWLFGSLASTLAVLCTQQRCSRDALQVEDRQQRLDRLRATQVGRQDRGREANAAGIASCNLTIAYTRLADRDRADTGQDFAFRQMAVAHNTLAAVLSLKIRMLGKKIRDLGLYGLSQQAARALPQDFGELVVKGSWLNQLEHIIVRHGISLLRWRSGGVKHPHDMPPFRFPPSPTSGDSSIVACS